MQPLSVEEKAGFKQLMHTACFKVKKRPMQGVVKVELTNIILHDKEKNQETEQIASQSKSAIYTQNNWNTLNPSVPVRKNLMVHTFRPTVGENCSALEAADTEVQLRDHLV